MKNLFLDDLRSPVDAFKETLYDNPHEIYISKKWVTVRNHIAFVDFILTNGIPEIISFDHDLAKSHYTPRKFWNDYQKSKEWQDAQVHEEKTGYDCALWLMQHCIENNLELPICYIHSGNPVGRDKIINALKL